HLGTDRPPVDGDVELVVDHLRRGRGDALHHRPDRLGHPRRWRAEEVRHVGVLPGRGDEGVEHLEVALGDACQRRGIPVPHVRHRMAAAAAHHADDLHRGRGAERRAGQRPGVHPDPDRHGPPFERDRIHCPPAGAVVASAGAPATPPAGPTSTPHEQTGESMTPSTPSSPAPASTPAVGRRGLLLGAAGAVAAGAVSLAAGVPRAAAAAGPASDPATRKPVLVGANPGLQLFDAQGACTAYASVWRVDWSPHGTGTVLVLWQPSGVTVCSARRPLARWVAEDFTRHFPELDGLPWPEPEYRPWPVHLRLSLADGMVARPGTIEATTTAVLDARSFTTADS